MTARPDRPRAVRAGLFTLVAVWLAVMAHVGAGGGLPDPAVLLSGGALIGFCAGGCAGRTRRWPAIAGALLVAQVALHLLFAVGAHGHAVGGHGHAAGAGHTLLVPGGPMLLAHLVAVLLSSLILSGAEAGLDRIRREVCRFLFALAPGPARHGTGPAVAAEPAQDDNPTWARLIRRSPRRGPPQAG